MRDLLSRWTSSGTASGSIWNGSISSRVNARPICTVLVGFHIKLMVEIYKTINHLNPPYMWDLFTKKVVEYDFRIKILCELPPARSQRFGTNSLIFKGSLLWNSLSDDTKTSQSLAIFKQKIRSWDGAHCTCNICRN